jgi:hypothetical protein
VSATRGLRACSLVLVCASLLAGCGKKGPPLPPLVILPAAPADFSAARRGDSVDVRFVVPKANDDGSEPANLSHVDVYALTGPGIPRPDDILARGTKVGTVTVNLPPDPEAKDTPSAQPPAPIPGAVDQGAPASLTDVLTLVPSADASEVRAYMAVGFNRRGRRGRWTEPIAVPMGTAPPAPPAPVLTVEETGIKVSWTPAATAEGSVFPENVYAVDKDERRLTEKPTLDTSVDDKRVEWGVERCYALRAVEAIGGLLVESAPSPKTCVTPKDTFAPSAPEGLNVVAAQGSMNLIWNANQEADVAGYILLRSIAPATEGRRVNEALIESPTFTDSVQAGAVVTYSVQAVDTAGNVSPPSASVTETAR